MMQSTSIAKAVKLLVAAVAAGGFIGSAFAAEGTTRVIVKFKDNGVAAVNMKAAVAAAKGSVKHEIFGTNAMAIEVPLSALKGLKNNPNIEYVEEDHKRYPFALTSPSTGTRSPGRTSTTSPGRTSAAGTSTRPPLRRTRAVLA